MSTKISRILKIIEGKDFIEAKNVTEIAKIIEDLYNLMLRNEAKIQRSEIDAIIREIDFYHHNYDLCFDDKGNKMLTKYGYNNFYCHKVYKNRNNKTTKSVIICVRNGKKFNEIMRIENN